MRKLALLFVSWLCSVCAYATNCTIASGVGQNTLNETHSAEMGDRLRASSWGSQSTYSINRKSTINELSGGCDVNPNVEVGAMMINGIGYTADIHARIDVRGVTAEGDIRGEVNARGYAAYVMGKYKLTPTIEGRVRGILAYVQADFSVYIPDTNVAATVRAKGWLPGVGAGGCGNIYDRWWLCGEGRYFYGGKHGNDRQFLIEIEGRYNVF